jgi:serine/threonine-protein kinase
VLGRQVAIKVLRDDLALSPEQKAQAVERVRQEARAASGLTHPAIVALHDLGDDPVAGLFLVFELVHGPTLREKLQAGPLPPAEVAQLARALGSALAYAHGKGVVHRDVKPENVMLPPTGPMLTDFGVSQPGPLEAGARSVLGTPAYSAPEVLASGAFSAHGDQFSLAATLFEALTGMRAFPGGDTASVAARVASAKQPAPTTLLAALRAFPHVDPILDRALAKEARNRFLSCEALTSVLANELDGSNTTLLTTPMPRSSIVPRATRRWQNVAALIGIAVIFLLAMAGRFHPSGDREGVSLKSVSSAFALTVAAGRASNGANGANAGVSSAAPRHPHVGPVSSASPLSATTSVTPNAASVATAASQGIDAAPAFSAANPPGDP